MRLALLEAILHGEKNESTIRGIKLFNANINLESILPPSSCQITSKRDRPRSQTRNEGINSKFGMMIEQTQ